MSKSRDEWWNEMFLHFRPFFNKKTALDNRTEVNYIIKKLNLKKGMSFLDCPCGIGRHTIGLAKRGIKVSGVDLTLSYLDEIDQKISGKNLPIRLFHSDMRKIDFENEFDGAGNLWTSIGFFEKESDNLLVLKKIYKALKPGGRFIIQTVNRDWIIKNFQKTGWSDTGDSKVLEKREFDYSRSTIKSVWTFIKNGQERDFLVDLRVYSYHELFGMLKKVGFVNIEGFGSLKEEPVSFDHIDQILIADKPKG